MRLPDHDVDDGVDFEGGEADGADHEHAKRVACVSVKAGCARVAPPRRRALSEEEYDDEMREEHEVEEDDEDDEAEEEPSAERRRPSTGRDVTPARRQVAIEMEPPAAARNQVQDLD